MLKSFFYLSTCFWFLIITRRVWCLDSENVMIETIDLTVEVREDGKSFVMEAYRSTRNDDILRDNKTNLFGQLEWHSIGSPTLTQLSTNGHFSSLSFNNVFQITPTGFYFLIEVLTDSQKEAFREKIKSKYGIRVDRNQIIKLVPSELKCTLKIKCQSGDLVEVAGETFGLAEFPLKVFFNAPINSKELVCFEHHVVEHQHVEANCVVRKKSKTVKQNVFRMTVDQMTKIDMIERLFGNASQVFVTRDQLGNLATEVYHTFRIFEEYEIREAPFSESFIDEMLRQTSAAHSFKPVPVDEALKHLSTYSAKDLDPDVIKRNLSKVLKVRKENGRDHIRVNDEFSANSDNEVKTEQKTNMGVKGLEALGMNGELSVGYVRNNQEKWMESEKSLRDQLAELNRESQDNVEWDIQGEMIIPKSLNLTRLIKSNFKKDLLFERIRRELSDFIFNKRFTLQYRDDKKLYQSMRNKFIDSSKKASRLEKTTTSSLFKCLDGCEENPLCHYANYRQGKCLIYDKTAFFELKTSNMSSTASRFYHRKMFAKKKLKGYRLTNWFQNFTNISSSKTCWKRCMKSMECVASSFHKPKSECFLFDQENLTLESGVNDQEFKTTCFANIIATKTYPKTRLRSNTHRFLNTISEFFCWNECLRDRKCVGVSYRKPKCYLLRGEDYLVEHQDGWVSTVYETQRIENKYSIELEKTQLVGESYLRIIVDNQTKHSCWHECLEVSGCVAVTFGESTCRLIAKGSFLIVRKHNWVSICLENETLQTNYTNRYEHMVLLNPFRVLSKKSELACWEECLVLRECVAVSFSHEGHTCKFFKRGKADEHLKAVSKANWVSITFENEILDHEMIMLEEKFETCQHSSMPIGIYRDHYYSDFVAIVRANSDRKRSMTSWIKYENAQIFGFYLVVNVSSEFECWNECVKKTECSGLSYASYGVCYLIGPGKYRLIRYFNWSSIIYNDPNQDRISRNVKFSVIRTLKGHTKAIFTLTVLQNGFLASGSEDQTIRVWNLKNGSLHKLLIGHTDSVRALIVLHNGNLVSGSSDKTIRIWHNFVDETIIPAAHLGRVNCLALLPNGDFASGLSDGSIKIWTSSGSLRKIFSASSNEIWSLVVLSNGDLASGSCDNTTKIWSSDFNSPNPRLTLIGHSMCVISLAVLENGQLVSGSQDKTIRVWNDQTGKLTRTFTYHEDKVYALGVLPNGDLISGSGDNSIKIKQSPATKFNDEVEDVTLEDEQHDDVVRCLFVLPNGDFASASWDKTIKIWSNKKDN